MQTFPVENDSMSVIHLPMTTVQFEHSDEAENMRWLSEHHAATRLICGCYWDRHGNSLLVERWCTGHILEGR